MRMVVTAWRDYVIHNYFDRWTLSRAVKFDESAMSVVIDTIPQCGRSTPDGLPARAYSSASAGQFHDNDTQRHELWAQCQQARVTRQGRRRQQAR
jgi:hypothetical protein